MSTAAKPPVEVHTDGACSGNPGPGGRAAILRHADHEPAEAERMKTEIRARIAERR